MEPELYPDDEFLKKYAIYNPPRRDAVGIAFNNLMKIYKNAEFNVLIIQPWLKSGGADKGATQFARFYRTQFKSVTMINTLGHKTKDYDCIDDVTIVEFHSFTMELNEEEKINLLFRFCVTVKPKIIHVINSEIGLEFVSKIGKALKDIGIRIIVSFFCDEITKNGKKLDTPSNSRNV
jgi:hypothetical protein